MDDAEIVGHINELADEEHRLERSHARAASPTRSRPGSARSRCRSTSAGTSSASGGRGDPPARIRTTPRSAREHGGELQAVIPRAFRAPHRLDMFVPASWASDRPRIPRMRNLR